MWRRDELLAVPKPVPPTGRIIRKPSAWRVSRTQQDRSLSACRRQLRGESSVRKPRNTSKPTQIPGKKVPNTASSLKPTELPFDLRHINESARHHIALPLAQSGFTNAWLERSYPPELKESFKATTDIVLNPIVANCA
jgi:hypothetical protein